jgi:hypothetical protein
VGKCNEEMALKDTVECRQIKELDTFTKMLTELLDPSGTLREEEV